LSKILLYLSQFGAWLLWFMVTANGPAIWGGCVT